MQNSDQVISTFTSARDNSPQTQTISTERLFRGLSKPTLVADGTDKESCPAWSPARFSGSRRDSNVIDVSVLVYDIDKENDGTPGLTPEVLKSIEEYWHGKDVAFLIHSSFSSGRYAPRKKIRIVVPLASPITVTEYLALWDEHAAKMAAAPDHTRRHPGGIFFDACVPESEAEHFYSLVVNDKPLLLTRTKLFNVNLNTRTEAEWIVQVRNATEKHVALNAAAFAIAAARTRAGTDVEGIWPLLEQALRENTASEPVRNWSEAKYTVEKAIRDGAKKALEGQEQVTECHPALVKRAQKKLKDALKTIGQDKESLRAMAASVGRWIPCGAVNHVRVREDLIRAAVAAGVERHLVEAEVDAGLAFGISKPEFVNPNWDRAGVQITKEGVAAASDENAHLVLAKHPHARDCLAFDVRKGLPSIMKTPPWESDKHDYPRHVTAEDVAHIARWAANELGCAPIGTARMHAAVTSHCDLNQRDTFVEYLDALNWDGTSRLDYWLRDYAGAEDKEYTRLIGRKFVVSCVARAYVPNCKVDTMMILCGAQGAKKSQLLRALAGPDYFCDTLGDISNKDTLLQLETPVIIEWAEMRALRKQEAEDVKHFLSSTAGHVRPAYERQKRPVLRRAVIAGTSNETGAFLQDDTGARRFWPVDVLTMCKPEALVAARDQLWAEAVSLYKSGHKWYPESESEESLVQEVQADKSVQDELEHELGEKINEKWPEGTLVTRAVADSGGCETVKLIVYEGQVSTDRQLLWITVLQACELIGLDGTRKPEQMRVSSILKRMKWLKKEDRRSGEKRKVWVRP